MLNREPGRSAETTSYLWLYRTGREGPPIIVYDYQRTRAGEHPREFLSEFSGYLHVDGYAGYHKDAKVILVVDDNPDIQKLVTAFLVHEGFIVRNALNAAQALAQLDIEEPDLILLDIQMPDMDGITLCNNIRSQYHRPILFVTGNKQADDRVKSLQSGGDDFITKPFDPVELVLRVKANLRWSSLLAGTEEKKQILDFHGLQIDLERMTVLLYQKPVDLLTKEMQLLLALATQPNQVFHPEQLYRQVWEDEFNYSKDTIKVHIHNLRKKIEPNPAQPRYIITVNQLGYKFNPYGSVESQQG